ncbi:MAG TPA: hypothetical protein VNA87_06465 [Actinomycetota bacterium]|nr:hypothetical protein [Actinomycetota bacterium]
MEWSDIGRWLGTGARFAPVVVAIVVVAGLVVQLRDRRRKQASMVTVERRRIDGAWKLIAYLAGEAPIRAVVAVVDDELDPPMFATISWPVVVAGVPHIADLEQNLLASILPLRETYFTDARGKHWRLDAKDNSVHRERKSIYHPDSKGIDAELLRRRSSRSALLKEISKS